MPAVASTGTSPPLHVTKLDDVDHGARGDFCHLLGHHRERVRDGQARERSRRLIFEGASARAAWTILENDADKLEPTRFFPVKTGKWQRHGARERTLVALQGS